MTKATYQILSNEALNSKGFVVLNSTIDWSRYLKNPILLRNKDTGEHFGQPIGRVEDIHLEKGRWIGKLVFGSSELAQAAKRDYEAGILNGVSIFGRARIVERNGRKYTTFFEVWEISLVNIPSNPDAVAIRGEDNVGLSAVSFVPDSIEIEQIESLSAYQTDIINQFENKMKNEEEKKVPETGTEQAFDDRVSLSAMSKFLELIGLASRKRLRRADEIDRDANQDDADAGQDQRDAREDRRAARYEREKGDDAEAKRREKDAERDDKMAEKDKKEADKDRREAREERASALAAEPATEALAATTDATTDDAKETKAEAAKPTALSAAEDARVFNDKTITKTKTMVKPFFKYIDDPENMPKIQAIMGLSASSGTADGVAEVSLSAAQDADVRESIQELSASMLCDPYFMATVQNMTFQVNDGRRESVVDTIQGLASGEKSGQFVQNADLAKISWLSLFVRQLFPPNTWADRVRRLSVRDKEGIIWVESAVNPDIYFGDRAPLNAPNYLYDDLPRGLQRKVFSMQPIVWQPANSDVLAYNDRATGQLDAMAKMSMCIHNYWLQTIAEAVPAANHLTMSGAEFDSSKRFPINSAAAGKLLGMTLNDLLAAQGRFIARNLNFRRGNGVAVFAEPYYTSLVQTDKVQSILTQQLSNARPEGFTYSGFDVMARSVIAAYNTATSTVVDAETYFDKPVTFATGAIDTAHVKPVLAATVYDIGLGFIPEEVVVAIGNTNIHMVSDPNNYGWKVSMDISTGAGTLRSSAAGIVLYRPTAAARV